MSLPLRHDDAHPAPMDAPLWRRRPKPAAPRDVEAPRFIGDRAMIELRRRLALDREGVPQPLDGDAGLSVDRLALRVCAVVTLAALVAWGVVSYSRAGLPANEVQQARVVAAVSPSKVKLVPAHTAAAAPRSAAAPVETLDLAQVAFAAEEKAPAPASAGSSSLQLSWEFPKILMAFKTPDSTPLAVSSPAAASKSAMKADQIATLIKRGKAFMTDGDVVAARLLLQRAAEAGNAEAALALAASFDPLLIKQAGAIGVQTDAALARQWYRKAQELGSHAASKQLANLASAGQ